MYLKSLALYKFLFQFVNEFTQGCIQCVTDPKQIDLTPAAASRDVSTLIDHEDAADTRGLTSPARGWNRKIPAASGFACLNDIMRRGWYLFWRNPVNARKTKRNCFGRNCRTRIRNLPISKNSFGRFQQDFCDQATSATISAVT